MNPGWLALPWLTLVLLGVVYPVVQVLQLGRTPGWGQVWTQPYYQERLVWSLTYGAVSALLTVGLALGVAVAFRYRFPGRRFLLALITLPLVLPPLGVALGFLSLVGPGGLWGINLYGTPTLLIWGAVFFNLGLVVRLLIPLLAGLEGPLEAAQTLGASPLQALRRIAVPLLAPALLGGGLLTFVYTAGSFALPLLLGGPRWATLEVEIYQLLAFRLAFPEATALGVGQWLILGGLVWGLIWAQQRSAVGLEGVGLRSLPPGRAWLLTLALWGLLLPLFAPLPALLWRAVSQPKGLWSMWQPSSFTPAGEALGHSLAFTGLALLLVVPLSWGYSYAVWRGWRWLEGWGLLPLVISPVMLALGYLLAYPQWTGQLGLLLAAYALLAYPLLSRALLPAMRALPLAVLEAAQTLGASPWIRFWRVEWPLLKPAFRSGSALAAAAILGEFGATLVLQRPEWATLTTAIYQRLGRPGSQPLSEAVALAALLTLLAGLLFWLVDLGDDRL